MGMTPRIQFVGYWGLPMEIGAMTGWWRMNQIRSFVIMVILKYPSKTMMMKLRSKSKTLLSAVFLPVVVSPVMSPVALSIVLPWVARLRKHLLKIPEMNGLNREILNLNLTTLCVWKSFRYILAYATFTKAIAD